MTRAIRLFLGTLLIVGCTACENANDNPVLFERLSSKRTGITFTNELTASADLSIVNHVYYYNGGGVAVGDVNGDGLVDLYFTANEGPNALYLNRGNFEFEDVTDAAGVTGSADWSSGVTMADINGDSRIDIYVSVVHDNQRKLEGHNELYINQGLDDKGIPQFEEQAAAYELDQQAYGTQSLFFDYDSDGDLDVYLLNSTVHRGRYFRRGTLREKKSRQTGDRLYRNDGDAFVEVTDAAGIYSGPTGFGLGVVASDLDRNGCPDLYVANDFYEHDYLYYNNCDGTFTEAIEKATRHVSYSSMGVDAADYNNDGRPDLAVLDMLPAREDILKTSAGPDTEKIYRLRRQFGYHHQLDRNTLQLNQGSRRFSEIGLLAGIAATDWSWAALFADLDNDGWKDLFVTNGIYRRPNDLDYIEFASQKGIIQSLQDKGIEPYKELQKRMPHVSIPNFAFHNQGDLTFADSTNAWGLDHPGFSNGATYADLDNNGSLDLVINNINEPASIYANRAGILYGHHSLMVQLEGEGANTQGFGANVTVHQGSQRQMLEQQPTRGFQSSVDSRLHFGLGTRASIDSLTVIWPDGRSETRTGVAANQMITLRQSDATMANSAPDTTSGNYLFTSTSTANILGIDFQHQENTSYNDFQREPLMPRKISTEGPALAVGDVTGNGLDDVYFGGARRQPGALFVQQSDGRFQRTTVNEDVWARDQMYEDVDATFFDANGNGALDLYVVSAGNEVREDANTLRDRLYLNDGTGTFRRAEGALPSAMIANGASVAPADFDGDGDIDLFVGSRVVGQNYGITPRSYLLANDGSGIFHDVTDEVAPTLREVGMVTDATWTDVTGNDTLDLIVVGEWMPITVFEQQNGHLVDRTEAVGLAETNGWWNAVLATDLNGDGTDDLIAGNLGLNTRLHATPDEPARLYLDDFDGNGQHDPILTHYKNNTSYLYPRRNALIRQIPLLKKKFPTYESFGASRIDDLFPADKIETATVKRAHTFASLYLESQGDSTFSVQPLPLPAQITPTYGILVHDIDGDGNRDVMLGGNFYGVRPRQGRYDASYGTLLRGNGQGAWMAVPPPESNLYLRGEVRALRLLRRADGARFILVAHNNARPQLVRIQDPSKP